MFLDKRVVGANSVAFWDNVLVIWATNLEHISKGILETQRQMKKPEEKDSYLQTY